VAVVEADAAMVSVVVVLPVMTVTAKPALRKYFDPLSRYVLLLTNPSVSMISRPHMAGVAILAERNGLMRKLVKLSPRRKRNRVSILPPQPPSMLTEKPQELRVLRRQRKAKLPRPKKTSPSRTQTGFLSRLKRSSS